MGWKEGAVAFNDVEPSAVAMVCPFMGVATGAIFDLLIQDLFVEL